MDVTIPIDQIEIDEFPLAVALRTIGAPWADENCRVMNYYTEGYLRKLGKTIEEAKAMGIEGDKQQWIFKRTPEVMAAKEIFTKLWATNDRVIDFPGVDLLTMLKIGILFLKNRGPLAADLKNHPGRVVVNRGGPGAMTLLTSTTPAAVREQMGLQ